MQAAVIGIGSNSVRSLVARNNEGVFERLYRGREGTRLFAGLDSNGMLKEESILKTAEAVRRMAEAAREKGTGDLSVFATSAARDAVNGKDFMDAIEQAAGIAPIILTGEEEARLSFFGASRAVKDECFCGVIDIGGGSTEIVLGRDGEIVRAVSCQMGAVRLYRVMPIEKAADMGPVRAAAADILEKTWGDEPAGAESWIGTGGTFTALAALIRGVPWTDREGMNGTWIRKEDVQRIGEKLADLSLAERLRLESLQPGRADIVVHGICILLAVMDRMGIERLQVSEYGNLDGYIRKHYRQRVRRDSRVNP